MAEEWTTNAGHYKTITHYTLHIPQGTMQAQVRLLSCELASVFQTSNRHECIKNLCGVFRAVELATDRVCGLHSVMFLFYSIFVLFFKKAVATDDHGGT